YHCLSPEIGKLPEQREQRPRRDTNSSCNATSAIHSISQQLQPATSGSLGMDVAAAVDVTIMTTHPHKIPTGFKGPIMINGRAVGGLLLGRSSTTMMGLFVLPGVIDADYCGEVMIMAYTQYPPLKISKGQRLAQLIPLPQITKEVTPMQQKPRGQEGFGSTGGLILMTVDLSDRPRKKVELQFNNQSITLVGLLDTGADSCIIAPQEWPKDWPLQASATTVTGVGGMTLANRTPVVTVILE
ncbi:POK9 protein, partial [Circaetus pectoralis]|nr:POK9 protein [Circaetus pectoralis]